jgi:hypothetical protein
MAVNAAAATTIHAAMSIRAPTCSADAVDAAAHPASHRRACKATRATQTADADPTTTPTTQAAAETNPGTTTDGPADTASTGPEPTAAPDAKQQVGDLRRHR